MTTKLDVDSEKVTILCPVSNHGLLFVKRARYSLRPESGLFEVCIDSEVTVARRAPRMLKEYATVARSHCTQGMSLYFEIAWL